MNDSVRQETGGSQEEGSAIRLPDGRALAYHESGLRRGAPVFLFHGLPGSRFQRPLSSDVLEPQGVRLITVDRPGIGGSDPQPGRKLLDWPSDVAALADALGIEQFHVVGVSGGGPYALACAHALPERVQAVATLASLGPFEADGCAGQVDQFGSWFFNGVRRWRHALWLAFTALDFVLRRSKVPLQPLMLESRCLRDQEILVRSDVQEMLRRDLDAATRQGVSGILADGEVLSQPWGFELGSVRTRVDVWHGTADTVIRLASGEHLAQALPHARRQFVEGAGHFSLPIEQMPEILEALLEPVSLERMEGVRVAATPQPRTARGRLAPAGDALG